MYVNTIQAFIFASLDIAGCRRPESEVLGLVDQMREERLSPDSYTFVAVIRTLKGAKGAYERARQLLEDAKTSLQGPTLARVYAAVISGCGPEARYDIVCERIVAEGGPEERGVLVSRVGIWFLSERQQ